MHAQFAFNSYGGVPVQTVFVQTAKDVHVSLEGFSQDVWNSTAMTMFQSQIDLNLLESDLIPRHYTRIILYPPKSGKVWSIW